MKDADFHCFLIFLRYKRTNIRGAGDETSQYKTYHDNDGITTGLS